MFDWINKTVMDMTLSDEIAKSFCIIAVLAVIGLIGWAIDKLENRRTSRVQKQEEQWDHLYEVQSVQKI